MMLSLLALGLLAACGSREANDQADAGAASARELGIEVPADGGPELVFTWIDDDGQHKVAQRRTDVPEGRRAVVRVQDPSAPPEDPTTVWIADLREPDHGQFPVRSMKRADFEKIGRPEPRTEPVKQAPPASPVPVPAAEPERVVMYSTSTCPVCRQARQWLAQQNISFVERNIERDQEAARVLQEKARSQGVPANGVPIFEIRGKLIPGFNKQALSRALGR